jgi:hypothetical protein
MGDGMTWVLTISRARHHRLARPCACGRRHRTAVGADSRGAPRRGRGQPHRPCLRAPGPGRGHVVDFLDYFGLFVGNVADIAIVVAAAGRHGSRCAASRCREPDARSPPMSETSEPSSSRGSRRRAGGRRHGASSSGSPGPERPTWPPTARERRRLHRRWASPTASTAGPARGHPARHRSPGDPRDRRRAGAGDAASSTTTRTSSSWTSRWAWPPTPVSNWTGPNVLAGLKAAGYRISTSGASERQGIVSRLDVGTSGLMVVCKSERAYTVLKRAFKERRVDKTYHTLVQGLPDPARRHRRRAHRAAPGMPTSSSPSWTPASRR